GGAARRVPEPDGHRWRADRTDEWAGHWPAAADPGPADVHPERAGHLDDLRRPADRAGRADAGGRRQALAAAARSDVVVLARRAAAGDQGRHPLFAADRKVRAAAPHLALTPAVHDAVRRAGAGDGVRADAADPVRELAAGDV